MPWFPDVFHAVARQRIQAQLEGLLMRVPYFSGLLEGDPEPLIRSFAGQPEPMVVAPIQPVVAVTRGLIAGWADRSPLNQYARSNYRTDRSWATWRNADCSAVALDWLLGAYGQQLGSLDDAIALANKAQDLGAAT